MIGARGSIARFPADCSILATTRSAGRDRHHSPVTLPHSLRVEPAQYVDRLRDVKDVTSRVT